MDHIKLAKERDRMCRAHTSQCISDCPLYKLAEYCHDEYGVRRSLACRLSLAEFPEDAVKIISKWRTENPEPRLPMPNAEQYDPPLDNGIENEVRILATNGIETYESCQGGPGHAFFEPTVRFHGGTGEGYRALGIALQYALRVSELRRCWRVEGSELIGPWWEMTFIPLEQ